MQQQPMHGMQLVLLTLAVGLGTFMQVFCLHRGKMRHRSYSKAASGRAYG